MTHREMSLAMLDTIKQQIEDAERCLIEDEHFNALNYIASAQCGLANAVVHLFISKTHKMAYLETSKE